MQDFTVMQEQAAFDASTWPGYEMKPGYEITGCEVAGHEMRSGSGGPVEGQAVNPALPIAAMRAEEHDFIGAMIQYVDLLLRVNSQQERPEECQDGTAAASSNQSSTPLSPWPSKPVDRLYRAAPFYAPAWQGRA